MTLRLRWRSRTTDADGWRDADRIIDELLAMRARDDAGTVVESLGSSGTVQAYPPGLGGHDWMINARWELRDAEVPLQCFLEFATAPGRARPLNEYPPERLADLLCRAGAAVGADAARIYTRPLVRALREATNAVPVSVGAVSYAPTGINPARLSTTLTVHERGAEAAVLADLDRVVHDPPSVVPALLALSAALTSSA